MRAAKPDSAVKQLTATQLDQDSPVPQFRLGPVVLTNVAEQLLPSSHLSIVGMSQVTPTPL